MRFVPVVALSAVVVLAAGCGAGTKAPSVASLGGTTTTDSSSPGSSAAVPRGGSFVKFVNCMRSHGVDAQIGQDGKGVSIRGNPSDSSRMAAAQTACRKYLPGGGPKQQTPQQQAQFLKRMVKLAKCMRSHGVSDFPDPTTSGGFPFPKLDTNAPQFEQAAKACGAAGPGGGGFVIRAGP